MQTQSGYGPVLVVLVSIALLSAMDALIKAAAAQYGTAQITFLRYLVGFAVALPFAQKAIRSGLPMQSIRANGLRGVVVLFTAFCFFFALGRLPLAFAVTIAFTAPLWMVVLSRLILDEPVPRRSLIAIGLGFLGVLVMIFGGGTDNLSDRNLDPLGILAALGASVGYALAIVLLRRQTAFDTIPVLVCTQAFVAMALIAPFGIATFEPLGPVGMVHFAAIGTLGTVGHFMLAWGFKRAPASRLAPIEYTTFLWAALFGFYFFSETPGLELLAGGALIVSGSLIVARGERR